MIVRTIWNAWQEQPLDLDWPSDWPLTEYRLPPRPPLADSAVSEVLERAIDDPRVATSLAGAQSACVLVDDHTRPVAWGRVLDSLLRLLFLRGVPRAAVTILATLAGHAEMSELELEWKLGRPPAAVRVLQHSLAGPFRWVDVGGQRVGLHEAYMSADFKLALGSLIPHPFAGWSGGAKAVMPGVADLETTRRNHAMAGLGGGKVADPANRIRRQMEQVAAASGLHLIVNGVVNGERELVALFAGPPDETYGAAVACARPMAACPPTRQHDLVLLNAYPKDREVLQVSNAFNVLRTLPPGYLDGVRDVVLVARATCGLGHHALFGPGGPLYRTPSHPSWLKNARLLVHSPGLDPAVLAQGLGGELVSSWDSLVARLGANGPRDAGFWHQASLQTAERA